MSCSPAYGAVRSWSIHCFNSNLKMLRPINLGLTDLRPSAFKTVSRRWRTISRGMAPEKTVRISIAALVSLGAELQCSGGRALVSCWYRAGSLQRQAASVGVEVRALGLRAQSHGCEQKPNQVQPSHHGGASSPLHVRDRPDQELSRPCSLLMALFG